MCTGKLKNYVTHFIVIFTILRWSGTKTRRIFDLGPMEKF